MGNEHSRNFSQGLTHSGFNETQLKKLAQRFNRLDQDSNGKLSVDEIKNEIPLLAQNPLVDRIVQILDKNKDNQVDFEEFMLGLSSFTVSDNKKEKLKFAFKIYDMDEDGFISNSDLYNVLHMMVGDNLPPVNLQQIVDKTMVYLGVEEGTGIDFDGFLSILERLANRDDNHAMDFEDSVQIEIAEI